MRPNPFAIQEGAVGDDDLGGTIKNRWVESALPQEDEARISSRLDEFLGLAIPQKKIKFFAIVIIGFFLIILSRIVFLQIKNGDNYFAMAEGNRLRVKPIVAERGIIYDRNGTALVRNVPNFSLVLTPLDLPKELSGRREIINKISALSGLSIDGVAGMMAAADSRTAQSVILRDNIDYQTAIALTVQSADLPGISLESGIGRAYAVDLNEQGTGPLASSTYPLSLSHVLGYVGKVSKQELEANQKMYLTDLIGKIGVEKEYESILRGVYGKREVEVDALGKEKNLVREEAPTPGKDLILSIDVRYQAALEQILQQQLRASGKKRGSAIAMDPRNGEILALVSLPTFDNNNFAQGISTQKYNTLITDKDAPLVGRAWAGVYPSGSVIKPVMAAAALTEGIITRNTSFLSIGGIQVDRWFFPDWKAGGHGLTNVIKAIAESVNTFFYYIGGGYKNFIGLGADRMAAYLAKFHFGAPLGLDLPGEAAGFIPTPPWKNSKRGEQWYIGDTYNLSIGQGDLLVTPLQIASMTATAANGGTIYKPHVGLATVDHLSGATADISTEILKKNAVPEAVLDIVREGMRAAVTAGSARSLSALPIEAAGKTGTAQWSKTAPTHAWFTSFAPYNNPKIVVTVMIEEGGEGSSAAAPVAREFYKWYVKNVK